MSTWRGEICPHDIRISAKTGQGIEDLRCALVIMLNMERHAPEQAVISERHRSELLLAMDELDKAADRLQDDRDLVLAAQSIKTATEALGRITGRIYSQDLLDRVFAGFCLGK
jgi:tRNA modification GTPase